MSTKRKGMLTTHKECHKHLRPYAKRIFWKGERKAGKRQGVSDVSHVHAGCQAATSA